MNRIYFLTIFLFFVLVGNSTTVLPPGIDYRLLNNTNDSIRNVIQIQSDSQDFYVYDTFDIEEAFNSDELRLIYTREGKIRKYQKLLVEFSDTIFTSTPFKFADEDEAFDVIINKNDLILGKTYFFKIRSILYHLLIIIPIFFFFKFIVILLPADFQMKLLLKEFLLINILQPVIFYFTLEYLSKGNHFLLFMLSIILFILLVETIIYNKKLRHKEKKGITIRVLFANILTILIGGPVTIFLQIFG